MRNTVAVALAVGLAGRVGRSGWPSGCPRGLLFCSSAPRTATCFGGLSHLIRSHTFAGTARLLIDYVDPQRSEILDLLFKPGYGASFQHLKVEIGGDAQISCGAEPSPMRSPAASDADFNRGCERPCI